MKTSPDTTKVNITYESLQSQNCNSSVIVKLSKFISNVYMHEYHTFPEKSRLSEYLQEVSLKLYNGGLDKFDPSKGSFNSWLYTLVLNTIRSSYRKTDRVSDSFVTMFSVPVTDSKTEKVNEDEFLSSFDKRCENMREKVSDSDRQMIFKSYQEAVTTLTPQRRKIFTMYLSDIPNKKIAECLNMTQNSVNAGISRTKIALRKKMSRSMADFLESA